MGATCERPGCGLPAAATFALDALGRILWIGDLEAPDARVNVLCAACADRLTAPRGWERRDVRDTPRLFAVAPEEQPPSELPATEPAAQPAADPAAAGDAAPRPKPRRRRSTKRAGADDAGPQAGAAPPQTAPPVPDSPPTLGLHRLDTPLSPDAGRLLAPGSSTPLLARAFRSAHAG